MKTEIYVLGLAILTFVAFGVAACGNSASSSDEETPQTASHNAMAHDAQEGDTPHDRAASPTPDKTPKKLKNGFDGMPAPGTKATCPIMGNDFEVKPNSEYSEFKGKTYVFCCPGCKPKFEADPEKFI